MTELLPWHHDQWQHIRERTADARLPHALLLTGKPGLGKRLFAEHMAQTLLCAASNPQATLKICGHCRSCRLFQANHHPDYLTVVPEDDKNIIRIDQVRLLSEFLTRTSQQGGYKIVLLAAAELLNTHAANSLLKTLEEPPGASLMLLLTAAPSKLPATLRSRCQRLSFYPPQAETVLDWLAQRLRTETNPQLLLNLAGGAPLLALQYEQDEQLTQRRQLFEHYQALMKGMLAPAALAEEWLKDKHHLRRYLSWLVGWHMDMIRLSLSGNAATLINTDLRSTLHSLTTKRSPRSLFQWLDAATELYDLSLTQANMSLQMENFFHTIAQQSKNVLE